MAISKKKRDAIPEQNNSSMPVIDLDDMRDIFTQDMSETRHETQRIQALQEENAALVEEVEDLRDLALKTENGSMIDLGRCQLTPVGLRLPDDLSHEEWVDVGQQLFQIEGSLQWMIGDWLAFAERKQYGEAKAIAHKLGKNPGTLHNWAWVSRELSDPATRYESLSHTHHLTVVSLVSNAAERAEWLARADTGDVINQASGESRAWSVSRLKAEIQQANGKSKSRSSRTVSKSAQLAKQMAEVAKLYSIDPEKLKPAQVKTFRRKIDALRAALDDLDSRIG